MKKSGNELLLTIESQLDENTFEVSAYFPKSEGMILHRHVVQLYAVNIKTKVVTEAERKNQVVNR